MECIKGESPYALSVIQNFKLRQRAGDIRKGVYEIRQMGDTDLRKRSHQENDAVLLMESTIVSQKKSRFVQQQ